MEYMNIGLHQAEVKFAADGRFTGYASVFGGVDSYGDTIHPGAFAKAVGSGREVKMYFNHGWRKFELPIGKMLVKEDERGLRVENAEFTPGLKMAEEVARAMQHGTVNGLSIGYMLSNEGFKSKKGGGRDIYEVAFLKEVSVVDWPADGAARIDMKTAIEQAKSFKDIEAILRDAGGFSRSDACALVSCVRTMARGDHDAEAKQAAEIRALFQRFP